METLSDLLERGWSQLLGRASGPMHLRLLLQPLVASILAIRAGLQDARAGRPAFLWTFVTSAEERRYLARAGWKDIGKVMIIAAVLDLVYQVVVLREIHILQTAIVVVAVAVVPYVLFRGPVARLARVWARRTEDPAAPSS